MIINSQILSIPPFISTAWKNVAAIHLEYRLSHPFLIITLQQGTRVEVPQLPLPVLELIFKAHTAFLEQQQARNELESNGHNQLSILGVSNQNELEALGLENLAGVLQHNPEQADAPPLPEELLSKIAALAPLSAEQDPAQLPRAEPHCNCVHCQIARALGAHVEKGQEDAEPVEDDELRFRSWDIQQTADKLYQVTNPLDQQEHYSVYLGQPLGCTCGENSCEHIKAVLNS